MPLKTDTLHDELRAAFPHASLHPMDCDCAACVAARDPVGVGGARHERIVRLQAALLGAFLVLLYGLALFLAPQIADALSSSPDRIEVSPPAGGHR